MYLAFSLVAAASTLAGAEPLLTQRPAHSCGTRQVRADIAPASPYLRAPGGQRTIYLNRFGGTYEVASQPTDSAHNIANTLVSANGRARTAVIPPLGTAFDWPKVAACVKEAYAPYNVRIVEVEPTTGPYVEAVVGGSGSALGYSPTDLFGIASADNFCGVTESGIAFTFAEAHLNVAQRDLELCATIAHEVGHLLALEHEVLGTDLMSYVLVAQTTSKSFVDQFVQCGTTPQQPSACACSGSGTTNSASRLGTYVGPRPVETVPPTLTIESPGNGKEVPPTFEVVTTASDDRAMSDVIVLVDDVEAGGSAEATNGQYKITVHGATLGPHTLTVIARDQAGNETAKEVPIVVAKLGIGETCLADDACQGGICANTTEGAFCTQSCNLSADDCPDGFECTAAGASAVCVASESTGCGCASNDPGNAVGPLLVFGLGALVMRRRRVR